MAIQRTTAAGVNMMTWVALPAEWQREWARLDTAALVTQIRVDHVGGSGIAHVREQQSLHTPVGAAETAGV